MTLQEAYEAFIVQLEQQRDQIVTQLMTEGGKPESSRLLRSAEQLERLQAQIEAAIRAVESLPSSAREAAVVE